MEPVFGYRLGGTAGSRDCSSNTQVKAFGDFVDFSSAFNTIIPRKLFNKIIHMGVERSLCVWILDFL